MLSNYWLSSANQTFKSISILVPRKRKWMAERKLIDWVKSERAKGISNAKLRVTLKKRGWPSEDIDKAVNFTHKGKVDWLPLIITFAIVFVMALILTSVTPLVISLFAFVLSLVYATIPYYKSKKRENYFELFIIIFTSALLSLLVSILFFNILVLIIYLVDPSVAIPFVIIIPSLTIILLFYTFYFTISRLSRHFIGYFDYQSFFVFKHWPFKIFNVNWKKKWSLMKFPLIIIVIGLIALGFGFQFFLDRANESSEELSQSIKGQMKEQMENICFDKIMDKGNISVVDRRITGVSKDDTKRLLFDQGKFSDVNVIYYGCNFEELTCKQKSFNQNRNIEDQIVFPEGISIIRIFETPDKTIILSPNYSHEDLFRCSTPFSERELQIEIVQQLEFARRNLLSNEFERQPTLSTWSNYRNGFANMVVDSTRLSLDLSFQRTAKRAAIYEWKNLPYDLTLEEKRINENIKLLYPQYLRIKPREESIYSGYGGFTSMFYGEYSFKFLVSIEKSFSYLLGRIIPVEKMEKEVNDLKENHLKEKIKEIYETRGTLESPESKVIRLKVIETLIVTQLLSTMTVEEQHALIETTGSPGIYSKNKYR
jgi:hypothetical protein